MAKEKAAVGRSDFMQFMHELLRTGIYKSTQGIYTRQVTCIVIWVVFCLGAYRIYYVMPNAQAGLKYALPVALVVAGIWIGYRVVNLPSFADFLIAVEAEMNKVSWPTQAELVRSSIVVIAMIFGLTIVLFSYDVAWNWLLTHILRVTAI